MNFFIKKYWEKKRNIKTCDSNDYFTTFLKKFPRARGATTSQMLQKHKRVNWIIG